MPITIGHPTIHYDPVDFTGLLIQGLKEGNDDNFGAENWELDLQIMTVATDLQEQMGMVEDMIVKGVDYIILAVVSWEGSAEMYRKVNEAGIPLIIVNWTQPMPRDWGTDALAIIGASHVDGGEAVAGYIAENYPEGTEMAIIQGQAIQLSFERAARKLHEDNGMVIVAEEYGDWNTDKAFDIATRIIAAHPDLKIIYACNSSMALGVAQAVVDSGKQGEIDVFGAGGIVPELELIIDGKMKGAFFRSSVDMGRAAADAIYLHLNGRADEIPEITLVPTVMVASIEDIKEHVPQEIIDQISNWPDN